MTSAVEALHQLIGSWAGEGVGYFPTIDDFSYREALAIEPARAGSDVLRYSQATWKRVADGEAPSHIETGFVAITADGGVEMLNAQGMDRVAVLSGSLTPLRDAPSSDAPGPDGRVVDAWIMQLTSDLLAHDDRMVSSWRTLTWHGDILSYEMGMSTTAKRDGAPHLRATLRRI